MAGGRVEPGETVQEAALREALEEARIEIRLEGVLRIENTIMGSRMRFRAIFLATPVNPAAPLKTIPDDESLRAEWKTTSEIEALGESLRSSEPLEWAHYLERGGMVYPLSVLAEEGDPLASELLIHS